MIAHVDMDAFYASVEVLDQPWLKGKPVIVGHGTRGVVAAASYEARALGVRSAMPIFQAKRLCPQGNYLPPRMERYRQVSKKVMELLGTFSPLVEQVSVDEAYLDLSGTDRLWGPPRQAGSAIKKAVRDSLGLTCSVGLAPVRFLAKIASDRDKPDGLTVVDEVEAFLATIPLAQVPGVGKKAQEKFKAMGVVRLVELRSLGAERLEKSLGVFGRRLWELAHGVDPTGVHPGGGAKSVSNEKTLAQDTADRELLASHLLGLSQKVCRRLRAKGLVGRSVTLKLKHADFKLITRSRALPRPSDQAAEVYGLARELLREYPGSGAFRLIGVGVSQLMEAEKSPQGLFDRKDRQKSASLSKAEDELVRRFGEKALIRGGILPLVDPKPDGGHNKK